MYTCGGIHASYAVVDPDSQTVCHLGEYKTRTRSEMEWTKVQTTNYPKHHANEKDHQVTKVTAESKWWDDSNDYNGNCNHECHKAC